MFDASLEAILARKYEAATERSMLRALKELRQVEFQDKIAQPGVSLEEFQQVMGSYLKADPLAAMLERIDLEENLMADPLPGRAIPTARNPLEVGRCNVPITIGRAR